MPVQADFTRESKDLLDLLIETDTLLLPVYGEWTAQDRLPDVKFGGPRGGVSTLFRLELLDRMPVLFLVEGEWDMMLLWEYCPDLCDVGTLGGAGAKLDALDLSILTGYLVVLVVHDDDKAGEQGREYFGELHSRFSRVQSIRPPAHDLTDFWKAGGNLRSWVAGQVAQALGDVLPGISQTLPQTEHWERIARLAQDDSCLEPIKVVMVDNRVY